MAKRAMERLVELHIHRWEKEKKTREKSDESLQKRFPVITISRQVGSGGGEIGELTAKRLRYQLLDRAIVESIAEQASVRQSAVETLDERALGMMEEYLRAIMKMGALSRPDYLKHLVEVLLVAARHGKVVIMGRGAGFLLRGFPLFRVRIVCTREIRIERISQKNMISMKAAEEIVDVTDAERALFVKNNFFSDINDAANYDLVINTESISAHLASDAIARSFRGSILKDLPGNADMDRGKFLDA